MRRHERLMEQRLAQLQQQVAAADARTEYERKCSEAAERQLREYIRLRSSSAAPSERSTASFNVAFHTGFQPSVPSSITVPAFSQHSTPAGHHDDSHAPRVSPLAASSQPRAPSSEDLKPESRSRLFASAEGLFSGISSPSVTNSCELPHAIDSDDCRAQSKDEPGHHSPSSNGDPHAASHGARADSLNDQATLRTSAPQLPHASALLYATQAMSGGHDRHQADASTSISWRVAANLHLFDEPKPDIVPADAAAATAAATVGGVAPTPQPPQGNEVESPGREDHSAQRLRPASTTTASTPSRHEASSTSQAASSLAGSRLPRAELQNPHLDLLAYQSKLLQAYQGHLHSVERFAYSPSSAKRDGDRGAQPPRALLHPTWTATASQPSPRSKNTSDARGSARPEAALQAAALLGQHASGYATAWLADPQPGRPLGGRDPSMATADARHAGSSHWEPAFVAGSPGVAPGREPACTAGSPVMALGRRRSLSRDIDTAAAAPQMGLDLHVQQPQLQQQQPQQLQQHLVRQPVGGERAQLFVGPGALLIQDEMAYVAREIAQLRSCFTSLENELRSQQQQQQQQLGQHRRGAARQPQGGSDRQVQVLERLLRQATTSRDDLAATVEALELRSCSLEQQLSQQARVHTLEDQGARQVQDQDQKAQLQQQEQAVLLKRVQRRCEGLEGEVEQMLESRRVLEIEVEMLRESQQAMKGEGEQLLELKQAMEGEVETVQLCCEALEGEVEMLHESQRAMEGEVEQLLKLKQAMEGEVETVQLRCEALEGEVEMLLVSREELMSECVMLQQQLEDAVEAHKAGGGSGVVRPGQVPHEGSTDLDSCEADQLEQEHVLFIDAELLEHAASLPSSREDAASEALGLRADVMSSEERGTGRKEEFGTGGEDSEGKGSDSARVDAWTGSDALPVGVSTRAAGMHVRLELPLWGGSFDPDDDDAAADDDDDELEDTGATDAVMEDRGAAAVTSQQQRLQHWPLFGCEDGDEDGEDLVEDLRVMSAQPFGTRSGYAQLAVKRPTTSRGRERALRPPAPWADDVRDEADVVAAARGRQLGMMQQGQRSLQLPNAGAAQLQGLVTTASLGPSWQLAELCLESADEFSADNELQALERQHAALSDRQDELLGQHASTEVQLLEMLQDKGALQGVQQDVQQGHAAVSVHHAALCERHAEVLAQLSAQEQRVRELEAHHEELVGLHEQACMRSEALALQLAQSEAGALELEELLEAGRTKSIDREQALSGQLLEIQEKQGLLVEVLAVQQQLGDQQLQQEKTLEVAGRRCTADGLEISRLLAHCSELEGRVMAAEAAATGTQHEAEASLLLLPLCTRCVELELAAAEGAVTQRLQLEEMLSVAAGERRLLQAVCGSLAGLVVISQEERRGSAEECERLTAELRRAAHSLSEERLWMQAEQARQADVAVPLHRERDQARNRVLEAEQEAAVALAADERRQLLGRCQDLAEQLDRGRDEAQRQVMEAEQRQREDLSGLISAANDERLVLQARFDELLERLEREGASLASCRADWAKIASELEEARTSLSSSDAERARIALELDEARAGLASSDAARARHEVGYTRLRHDQQGHFEVLAARCNVLAGATEREACIRQALLAGCDEALCDAAALAAKAKVERLRLLAANAALRRLNEELRETMQADHSRQVAADADFSLERSERSREADVAFKQLQAHCSSLEALVASSGAERRCILADCATLTAELQVAARSLSVAVEEQQQLLGRCQEAEAFLLRATEEQQQLLGRCQEAEASLRRSAEKQEERLAAHHRSLGDCARLTGELQEAAVALALVAEEKQKLLGMCQKAEASLCQSAEENQQLLGRCRDLAEQLYQGRGEMQRQVLEVEQRQQEAHALLVSAADEERRVLQARCDQLMDCLEHERAGLASSDAERVRIALELDEARAGLTSSDAERVRIALELEATLISADGLRQLLGAQHEEEISRLVRELKGEHDALLAHCEQLAGATEKEAGARRALLAGCDEALCDAAAIVAGAEVERLRLLAANESLRCLNVEMGQMMREDHSRQEAGAVMANAKARDLAAREVDIALELSQVRQDLLMARSHCAELAKEVVGHAGRESAGQGNDDDDHNEGCIGAHRPADDDGSIGAHRPAAPSPAELASEVSRLHQLLHQARGCIYILSAHLQTRHNQMEAQAALQAANASTTGNEAAEGQLVQGARAPAQGPSDAGLRQDQGTHHASGPLQDSFTQSESGSQCEQGTQSDCGWLEQGAQPDAPLQHEQWTQYDERLAVETMGEQSSRSPGFPQPTDAHHGHHSSPHRMVEFGYEQAMQPAVYSGSGSWSGGGGDRQQGGGKEPACSRCSELRDQLQASQTQVVALGRKELQQRTRVEQLGRLLSLMASKLGGALTRFEEADVRHSRAVAAELVERLGQQVHIALLLAQEATQQRGAEQQLEAERGALRHLSDVLGLATEELQQADSRASAVAAVQSMIWQRQADLFVVSEPPAGTSTSDNHALRLVTAYAPGSVATSPERAGVFRGGGGGGRGEEEREGGSSSSSYLVGSLECILRSQPMDDQLKALREARPVQRGMAAAHHATLLSGASRPSTSYSVDREQALLPGMDLGPLWTHTGGASEDSIGWRLASASSLPVSLAPQPPSRSVGHLLLASASLRRRQLEARGPEPLLGADGSCPIDLLHEMASFFKTQLELAQLEILELATQVDRLSSQKISLAGHMKRKDRKLMELAISESDAFSALTQTQAQLEWEREVKAGLKANFEELQNRLLALQQYLSVPSLQAEELPDPLKIEAYQGVVTPELPMSSEVADAE